MDAAALNAGSKKVRIAEGNFPYKAALRDVLQVLRALIKRKRSSIPLWRGVAGPAPPSDRRETPMDGDAFKLCEELVMKNWREPACALGLNAFSDSRQISWSGSMLLMLLRCFC